jgi:hypothetical protein
MIRQYKTPPAVSLKSLVSIVTGRSPRAIARSLAPGMPVEVFFSTGGRTMLSYLVKPLADQIDRAFREE